MAQFAGGFVGEGDGGEFSGRLVKLFHRINNSRNQGFRFSGARPCNDLYNGLLAGYCQKLLRIKLLDPALGTWGDFLLCGRSYRTGWEGLRGFWSAAPYRHVAAEQAGLAADCFNF